MISFNPLWKTLIDKGLKKSQLTIDYGINSVTVAKMGRNESVTTTTISKICEVLNCNVQDVIEYVPDTNE